MQNELKNIIESLLFVADNPIDMRTLKQVIPDADAKEIRQNIIELMAEYEARQGGFLLSEVAGGFQFRTRPDYKEWIKKLVKPSPVRLSKAALETLAIIAYHQPVIRADVERIRGVDSGAIIRSLLERKLVRILGKKEIPGRPLIYATTRRFLEIFNLKSLSDMPTLKEIQEFGKAGTAEELAAGLAERQGPEGAEAFSSEQGAEPPEGDKTDSPENTEDIGTSEEGSAGDSPGQAMETPEEDAAVSPDQAAGTDESNASDSKNQEPDNTAKNDADEEKSSENK